MAVNWSAEEIDKIQKQSLGDLAPFYYYPVSKSMRQIDTDMEGYLILQPKDQKQKVLEWIKNVVKVENDNVDRDILLQMYFKSRIDDTTARIEELDTTLNKYSELQGELLSGNDDPSRFASIIDLNQMIRSISRMVDSISIQRDQAFHEQNLTNLLKNVLDASQSNEDTQKELKSWTTVVSAYPGQKSKPKKSPGTALNTPVF